MTNLSLGFDEKSKSNFAFTCLSLLPFTNINNKVYTCIKFSSKENTEKYVGSIPTENKPSVKCWCCYCICLFTNGSSYDINLDLYFPLNIQTLV